MREQNVVVAVVQDQQGRFLVTYNEKWSGYSFPLQDFDPNSEVMATVAVEALERDLHCRLPKAKAEELEYLGKFGRSERTGEETWYDYWLFEIDVGQPLDLAHATQGASHPPLFLAGNALLSRTDLTWSTPVLAREFLDNQDAVLTVITRPGLTETEYLVVWHQHYQGFFFPSARIMSEHKPEQVATRLVRAEFGYRGPVVAQWRGEALDVHFSGRVLRNRSFHFHVCQVDVPDIDLQQPFNPLELALQARGKRWHWLTAGQLADGTLRYTSTMAAVRPMVVGLIPPTARCKPSRQSEGGLALIERTVVGQKQWLAQWNDRWQALFFVGGHREAGESFRECLIREVQEELGLKADDFTVDTDAVYRLQYEAVSLSAGCDTSYHQEFFRVAIKPSPLSRVEQRRENVWLTELEILRLEAFDSRQISVTMLSLLLMSRQLCVE